LAELIRVAGDPMYAPKTQSVSPAWERVHLITAMLPCLPRRLYVHRVMLAPLMAALERCARIGGYVVRSAGCFSPRSKRGSNRLSVHTWAMAIDIDPDVNPYVPHCPVGDARRVHAIPDSWIDAFEAEGFEWGGRWQDDYDAMHFQWVTGY
jgi:hypothetical protein